MMTIDEEQLILQVQARPILYDKDMQAYKKKRLTDQMWREIAKAIDSDVFSCKKRWRSLRDAFLKNYRFALLGKKISWCFYPLLEFLIPHVEVKEGDADTSSDNKSDIEYNRSQMTQLNFSQRLDELLDPTNSQASQEQPQNLMSYTSAEMKPPAILQTYKNLKFDSSKRPILNNRSIRKRQHYNFNGQRLLQALAQQNDPDKQFLLSLLPALKRLPPKKNAEARMKLQHILYDVEFRDDVEQNSATEI